MAAATTSSCAMCDKNAELACPSCNQVWYCSPQHAKEHNHSNQCKPFKINISPELGRHLVATRALKAGEVVMKDSPLAVAPGQLAERVCFGCHKIFIKAYECRDCGSPLCNKTCKMSLEHQRECVYLRRIAGALAASNSKAANREEVPVGVALFLMPLRCLLLRLEDPKKWDSFIQMEAHVDVRRQTPNWSFVERRIAPHLMTMLAGQIPDLNADLVQRICGILDVNSFEIRIKSDPSALNHGPDDMPNPLFTSHEVLRGSYHQAALMAHSCIPNAQISIGLDHLMVVRAQTAIRQGEIIYVSYTDPFQTAFQRRNFLARGKFFICKCRRCQDPSECGTYASALLCQSCPDGTVLPDGRTGQAMRWACSSCAAEIGHEEATRMEEVVQNIVKNLQRLPVDRHLMERCEELFVTLPKKMHSNHVMLMQLRIHLIHLYGNIPGYQMTELPVSLLQRKAQLCFELLEVLKTLCPGHSRIRGIVLYEFHAPLVVIASKKFENGNTSQEQLTKELKETESILKEAVEILIYEPVGSPEHFIARAAMADLKQLREYIREMEQLCQLSKMKLI